jgi:alkylation response protein AidB-like acyl-CoA dehydrogenase
MDITLNEQQEMLRKSAKDFIANRVPKKLVRDMESDPKGFVPELWQEMAGLGWMGLVFPEKYGGIDFSFLDLCVILEEMGRGAVPGPFFSTVVMTGMLINEAGTDEQKAAYLPRISEGKLFGTAALTEASASADPALVDTTATPSGTDYLISGTKFFIPDAHVANIIIVSARTAGGVTLFIVDAASPGIKVTPMSTFSGDKQCVVEFNSVKVPASSILGGQDKGVSVLEKFLPKAVIAKCTEMVGGFGAMFDMTLDYGKTRIAFGKPIGTFQALQVKFADMLADLESSRIMTYKAAWRITNGLPVDRLVPATKAWVSESFRRQTFVAHQIHGAIGFTWDHDLQLFIRRSKTAEMMLGTPQEHREKLMKVLGL